MNEQFDQSNCLNTQKIAAQHEQHFASQLPDAVTMYSTAEELFERHDDKPLEWFLTSALPSLTKEERERFIHNVMRVNEGVSKESFSWAERFLSDTIQLNIDGVVSPEDVPNTLDALVEAGGMSATSHADRNRRAISMAMLKTISAIEHIRSSLNRSVEDYARLTDMFADLLTDERYPLLFTTSNQAHYDILKPSTTSERCTTPESSFAVCVDPSAGLSIPAELCLRTKTINSMLLKFFGKLAMHRSPDHIVSAAAKDIIGVRITVPRTQVTEVACRAVDVLATNATQNGGTLESIAFEVSGDPGVDIRRLHEAVSDTGGVVTMASGGINTISSGRFQTVKCVCTMHTEDGERVGAELMIVPQDHRNEAGLSNHYVYDCAKVLRATSFLLGGVPSTLVRKNIRRAAEKSGLQEDTIFSSLTQWGKQTPIRVERFLEQHSLDDALARDIRQLAPSLSGILAATGVPSVHHLRRVIESLDHGADILEQLRAYNVESVFLRMVLHQQQTPVLLPLEKHGGTVTAYITAGVARDYCNAAGNERVNHYCHALHKPLFSDL